MNEKQAELKKMYYEINRISNSDFARKGEMIRKAFALSIEYAQEIAKFSDDAKKMVFEKISTYGNGWFVDNFQALVIVNFDKANVVSHVKSWNKFYSL